MRPSLTRQLKQIDDDIFTVSNIFDGAECLELVARAESIATFILDHAMPNGRLVRSWRDRPGTEAFAEDIASVAVGMYTLFGVTGDVRWYDTAETLVADLRDRFRSPTGAFYATADDAETLITRPVNIQDNPTPSDNALAMEALLMHAETVGHRIGRLYQASDLSVGITERPVASLESEEEDLLWSADSAG